MSPADQLILDAAAGVGQLTESELDQVIQHVAAVGFHPTARIKARHRLAGLTGQGRVLTVSDRLHPDEEHYLWHVVKRQEWPNGTSLSDYLGTIRRVVLDPTSGIFTNRYGGQWSLGVMRESLDMLHRGSSPRSSVSGLSGWSSK